MPSDAASTEPFDAREREEANAAASLDKRLAEAASFLALHGPALIGTLGGWYQLTKDALAESGRFAFLGTGRQQMVGLAAAAEPVEAPDVRLVHSRFQRAVEQVKALQRNGGADAWRAFLRRAPRRLP